MDDMIEEHASSEEVEGASACGTQGTTRWCMMKTREASRGSPLRLPVIDFSKQELKPGSPEWDSAKHHVREALEEYGCFEASLNRVLEVRKAVFGALEELFDLPLQTKQLYVSDKPSRGYNPAVSGLHEHMVIDAANIAENIERGLTTTLWPHGNISFSKTLVSFTELASGLEKTIRRMILEIFGVEKYADELIESTNYLLKVIKYEGSETSEPYPAAHFDKSMITLLYQNEVNGLEIQNKDGEWIHVNPSPNSFIVLIGESLNVWLNGGLSSTFHRVIKKGINTRYCVALFATPRGGYQVKNEAASENVNAYFSLLAGVTDLLAGVLSAEVHLQLSGVRFLECRVHLGETFACSCDYTHRGNSFLGQWCLPRHESWRFERLYSEPWKNSLTCLHKQNSSMFPTSPYVAASGLHEHMVIDTANIAENIERGLTTTLCPHGSISFSKPLVSFTELASGLEKTIRRMILEIFGVKKYVDELIEFTNYILKVMKYEGKQAEMSSESSPLRLPVIDFSKQELKPGSPDWDSVKHRVREALEEYGCFEASLDRVLELASRLEKTIKRMILEIFGVEKYANELIESTNYILKVIKYEGSETREPCPAAHSDQSMLTLLYQNEVNGLEIQNKDGEWIHVNPSPNSFIVLIGESLNVWLNGGLSSTFHRVIKKGSNTRYCVALFTTPRGGYQVKVPKELVDDKIGLLFKPFDYDEFWTTFCTQAAQGICGYDLKTYCTV
ncbi:hypothetical protein GQ457_09G012690 [Hibiscus cannabinus]